MLGVKVCCLCRQMVMAGVEGEKIEKINFEGGMDCLPLTIIQGLKESGVFSSVIASAPMALSRNKFLSPESKNLSTSAASGSLSSRKFTRSRQFQAAARRVLELSGTEFDDAAIPPLSPPALDDVFNTDAR